MNKLITLLLIGFTSFALGQPTYSPKEVFSGNIYVASTAGAYNPLASNKHDRVLQEVKLPAGTVSYTFRITVSERVKTQQSTLIGDIAKLGTSNFTNAELVANLISAG